MLYNSTPCWCAVCWLFLLLLLWSLSKLEQDFFRMTPVPACLLANLLTAVTVCALFGNKLAFFFSFKTTPDYFKCILLGTKRFWFSLHCKRVFISTVAKETERVAHPILVISEVAACGLWVLLCVASRTNVTCPLAPLLSRWWLF